MKAIGIDFDRTGTSSLQSALEKLLGGKGYHMKADCVGNLVHILFSPMVFAIG